MAKDEDPMRDPSAERVKRETYQQQRSDDCRSGAMEPREIKEEWIGHQLRKVYNKALSEPVPDRLLDLLKKLKNEDPDAR